MSKRVPSVCVKVPADFWGSFLLPVFFLLLFAVGFLPMSRAFGARLEVGGNAPLFTAVLDTGVPFSLLERKGKGWTVLYFYPKAETPGCTTQACAFRDSIKVIRDQGAEVYGVSTDSPKQLAGFRKNHSLNFSLISDANAQISEKYGVKMPVVQMAKRWTFILDSDLKIRHIDNQVDPAKDAKNVAEKLRELKNDK